MNPGDDKSGSTQPNGSSDACCNTDSSNHKDRVVLPVTFRGGSSTFSALSSSTALPGTNNITGPTTAVPATETAAADSNAGDTLPGTTKARIGVLAAVAFGLLFLLAGWIWRLRLARGQGAQCHLGVENSDSTAEPSGISEAIKLPSWEWE